MRLTSCLILALLAAAPGCARNVAPAHAVPARPSVADGAKAPAPRNHAQHGALPFAEMLPDERSLFDEREPRDATREEAHSADE